MENDLLVTLKSLADVTRLRIVGRLADRSWTASELASILGITAADARRHLERLVAAGLAARSEPAGAGATAASGEAPGPAGTGAAGGAAYELRPDAVHALGRRLGALEATRPAAADVLGPDGALLPADEARILHAFFDGDRLVSIPAQARKRQVVVRYLRDRCFTEDRAYPEKEVNQRLALFHPDVASLRREMVDTGLLTREGGEYRRPS